MPFSEHTRRSWWGIRWHSLVQFPLWWKRGGAWYVPYPMQWTTPAHAFFYIVNVISVMQKRSVWVPLTTRILIGYNPNTGIQEKLKMPNSRAHRPKRTQSYVVSRMQPIVLELKFGPRKNKYRISKYTSRIYNRSSRKDQLLFPGSSR